jgi:hypothetical protein
MATVRRYHILSDLPLTLPAAGLANNRGVRSGVVSNLEYGFKKAFIQVRVKTGLVTSSSPTVSVVMRRSVNGTDFTTYELSDPVTLTVAANQTYTVVLEVADPPPFWAVEVWNQTGAALSSSADQFGAVYAGQYEVETALDQFVFTPTGAFLGTGDATESSFPLVLTMSGGLLVYGSQDIPVQTMTGLFRLSGVASVQTPWEQVGIGRLGFTGAISGPSAVP